MKPWRAYKSLEWFIFTGFALAGFFALVAVVTLYGFGSRSKVAIVTVSQPVTLSTPQANPTSLDTTSWQTYRNGQRGYTLRYPSDWTFAVYDDANLLFNPIDQANYTNPDNEPKNAVVVDAAVMDNLQTIESIAQRGPAEGKTVHFLTVAGLPAVQHEDHAYTHTFVISGDVLYMIVYTKGAGGTAGNVVYRGMIESFAITAPADTTGWPSELSSKALASEEALAKGGWKTYRNEEFGFEVRYPENTFQLDITRATLTHQLKNSYFYSPKDGSKIGLAQDVVITFTKELSQCSVKNNPTIFINGLKITQSEMGAEGEGQITYCIQDNSGKNIFSIKRSYLDSSYSTEISKDPDFIPLDEQERLINQILSTFKFIEPARITTDQRKKILYQKGDDLILWNSTTKGKKKILTARGIIDYVLSPGQQFMAYTLPEEGFTGNSDIYLKNLQTGVTTRLTEKNSIASRNPKIFSDNRTVAFVRQSYDPATPALLNPEIWIMGTDGDPTSAKKLLAAKTISYPPGYWCTELLKKPPGTVAPGAITIESLSPTGDAMLYWQMNNDPGCSEFPEQPAVVNLPGKTFVTEKIEQQFFGTDSDVVSRAGFRMFWLPDGDFVASDGLIQYYDSNQNLNWVIYDWNQEPKDQHGSSIYDTQIFLEDVRRVDDRHLIVAYTAYKRLGSTKYFVDELEHGERIDVAALPNKKPIAEIPLQPVAMNISNFKLLNATTLIYLKERLGDRIGDRFELMVHDIATGREEKIDGWTKYFRFER